MDILNIDDGLNLLLSSTKKFKTVSIGMLIRRPLNRNEVTINALIPAILKRGCEKYPSATEINKHTELMYGAVFDAMVLKKGEQQLLQFFIEVLNKDNLLNEAIDFLYEITMKPLIDKNEFITAYIEGEKENLKKTIASRINDKKEYSSQRCIEEMFSDEPFGLYGDGYAEDIDGITGIYAHYQNILKTSPVEFIVIGDIDQKSIYTKFKDDFSIERDKVIAIDNPKTPYSKKEEATEVFEQLPVSQGKLCIGLKTNINPIDEDFYKLLLVNEILGGGANSKFFINIREKEGLCYYINSAVYRFKTAVLIQAGIEEETYEKTVALIKNEIKNILDGNITDYEISSAVKSLRKKYAVIEDYPSQYMDFYLSQYMLNDSLTISQVIDKISSVNKDCLTGFDLYTDTVYFLKGDGK